MQTVTAKDRQSVIDIITQVYGTVEALPQFLADNATGDFDMTAEVPIGTKFLFDDEIEIANKKILRKTDGKFFRTYVNPITSNETDNAEFNNDFNFDFTS